MVQRLSAADKKAIVTSIVVLLRMGVDPKVNRQEIVSFLKMNNIVKTLSAQAINKFFLEAKKIVKSDFYTNAWMTEKAQNAMMGDIKDTWVRHEKIITECENRFKFLKDNAKRICREVEYDEKRYQEFITTKDFIDTIQALKEANKDKLEMLKTGFWQFRIKRYIESLQEGRTGDINMLESDPLIRSLNKSPLVLEPKEKQKQIDEQKENAEFQLAEHLKPFEEKLNKRLSSLQE